MFQPGSSTTSRLWWAAGIRVEGYVRDAPRGVMEAFQIAAAST
jgi:hypothetical protein